MQIPAQCLLISSWHSEPPTYGRGGHTVCFSLRDVKLIFNWWQRVGRESKHQRQPPKRLKSERGATKYKNIWLLGNGLCFLKINCKEKPFIVFHFWEFQEDIAVSPQYWTRAATSKVVEQQAASKISNLLFWFSQNQKTNSILRKGFEIENSIAVMSPLNGHNKGPYKRSFRFQHLWCFA